MLKIDNKVYRNLEEQVQKNKQDIAKHYEVDRVLADWGIKVIGVVATVEDIPVGVYEYGDSYGISSTSPMKYVVWTRANELIGEDEDYWLNVGALSLVGPQGPQGIQGNQGIQGVRGSIWYSSTTTPTPSTAYNTGDEWLHTTTGNVYRYFARNDGSGLAGSWSLTGNIRGPQGVQGPTGPTGFQGVQGPTGPQGPKGDTGASFTIAGLLNSASSLPIPTESNRHQGYAVLNQDGVTYDLYVVVGTDTLEWVNMGQVQSVEGPQGPTGPQGPAGADIQIVHITGIPSTSTQGTLSQEQVNTLLAHPSNYIQFFNENFYPQDVETSEGYIVYSHVGQTQDGETIIKNISLTLATRGWVLTETSLVSSPITIVNDLPTANEENFEKGKIYTQGELLKYIAKIALSEPNLSQVATLITAAYDIAAAAVGTDIYLFGGNSSSALNTINKFSTTTGILTTLSATLPTGAYGIAAAAVGTDIYLFGGKIAAGSSSSNNLNTINKLSTTTGILTTLSTTLPTGTYDIAAAAVGTDIYLFGGSSSSNLNTISKFSTTTGILTTLSATLPTGAYDIAAAAVGTDIYLFGGKSSNNLNTINKFSTTTGILTTLSATLPTGAYLIAAAAVGTDIYLFGGNSLGGSSSSNLNTINKFSTTTGILTTLSTTLPAATNSIAAAAVGTDIYLFGGKSSSALNTISKVSLGFTYQYKTIATEE